MTEDKLVDAELADLYGAYLIFRESEQGVEGFRKYMRDAFDPKSGLGREWTRAEMTTAPAAT